jgi:hypothetical protein
LVTGHVVRLRLRQQIDDLKFTVWPQTGRDFGGRTLAGGIAVQQQDHALEPLPQQALLRG